LLAANRPPNQCLLMGDVESAGVFNIFTGFAQSSANLSFTSSPSEL
jgi:hypothetical protein